MTQIFLERHYQSTIVEILKADLTLWSKPAQAKVQNIRVFQTNNENYFTPPRKKKIQLFQITNCFRSKAF